jgi:CRISPR/Cas system-associated protein Cas10 (large subunit of type III CRISPR-Cas system)
VKPLQEKNFTKIPTLSVGVVIAHHQEHLRSALDNTFHALDQAKEIEGKDAFCICLSRRSSGDSFARSKWSLEDLDVISLMISFQKAYNTKSISPRWLKDLEFERKALGDPPARLDSDTKVSERLRKKWNEDASKLMGFEIARLLERHSEPDFRKSVEYEKLVNGAKSLNKNLTWMPGFPGEFENLNRYRDFLGLMDTAHYIAKGGGR